MTTVKNKSLFIGIITLCISALSFAYFTEYILNHMPCNLCLVERIPYAATIIVALLALISGAYEKAILIIIGIFFIIGMAISFYHFGIEQGFFSESLVCDLGKKSEPISAKELLKELNAQNISCKDVTFRVFGFSLATLNTIISFLISVIVLRTGFNYGKN